MTSSAPHSTDLPLAHENGGARSRGPESNVWKSIPTWRGVDIRPNFVLAELAEVEVEYRLAAAEADDQAAIWTMCPSCAAPMPLIAGICCECGYHHRLGRRVDPLAQPAPAPPRSFVAYWLTVVERLAGWAFPKHRALCVRDRAFNDQDLMRLKRLRRYRSLDFEGTQISDDALDCLARLRRLEFLIVRGTRISPDGVAYLRQKLPRCEIVD